jgi:hypothetical protein
MVVLNMVLCLQVITFTSQFFQFDLRGKIRLASFLGRIMSDAD